MLAISGVERVTLAEIARRARVSRPTVYRRWPDTHAILAAMLTRPRHQRPARRAGVAPADGSRLIASVAAVADLRRDALMTRCLRSAPEMALVYIVRAARHQPAGH